MKVMWFGLALVALAAIAIAFAGERLRRRLRAGKLDASSECSLWDQLADHPRQDRRAITIVVARARNGVIGRDGELPWHLPVDLKRFKALTTGTVMIMGRKTFDSLPGLLPGRKHVVLTRDPHWQAEGAEVAHTVEQALAFAGDAPVSVIGGAEIFGLFLPLATRLELTEVLADVAGDTSMPDPRRDGQWRELARDEHPAEGDRPAFAFVTLERA